MSASIGRRGIRAVIFDLDGVLVDSEPAHHAATQRLVELIEQEPEGASLHILTLVREAPDEAHRSWVGAGPLEDLVCHHGSLFIDRIETAAAVDGQLRKCLGYVCGETRMAPSLYSRMRRAAGAKAGR